MNKVNPMLAVALAAFTVCACAATSPTSPNTSTNSSTNATNNSAGLQFLSTFQGSWTNFMITSNSTYGYNYYTYTTFTITATNCTYLRIAKSNNVGTEASYQYRYVLYSNFSTSTSFNTNVLKLMYLCQTNNWVQTQLMDLSTNSTPYYNRMTATYTAPSLIISYSPSVLETNFNVVLTTNYALETSTNYIQ